MKYKTNISRFLIKILVFIVTIVLADAIIGKQLQKLYFNQSTGPDAAMDFAINKATPQTLILGSSRAVNIFDPCVFNDALNTKTLNAGRLGQSVFYHYALLRAMLKRHTPQIVILSIDRGAFATGEADYDKLSQLAPYYATHSEIKEVVNHKGFFEPLKMLSSIYPYNSMLLPIVRQYFYPSQKPTYHGYQPLDMETTTSSHKIDYNKKEGIDSTKVNTYKAIIAACKKASVQLFIVCPPYLVKATGHDATVPIAKQIALLHDTPFWDYSSSSQYSINKKLFADFRHLNEDGSLAFSKEIAIRISDYLITISRQQSFYSAF